MWATPSSSTRCTSMATPCALTSSQLLSLQPVSCQEHTKNASLKHILIFAMQTRTNRNLACPEGCHVRHLSCKVCIVVSQYAFQCLSAANDLHARPAFSMHILNQCLD